MTEKDIMCCKHNFVHEDKVNLVEHEMPKEENLLGVTELFKVLGDPTRTKILSVLYTQELCVCDISKVLNMTKSAISHQLKILKMARLIQSRKAGKEVYYALADDHVGKIYRMAIEHVME
ncbi:MAG: metalloregulator ArsR/SmtB family transcription factor [Prevotella sp.]|nr:metalloregulator ArsR/SmtB family transcription factor [Staphylococcus sp.]MCM1350277.1 metalloregulator ArsR/SmtB family transcription factor [Prevotella sp.]